MTGKDFTTDVDGRKWIPNLVVHYRTVTADLLSLTLGYR
jgi:hypothetical protein